MKKKILILVSGYLPGYKSGGPVRTIENMVETLKNFYDFKIICSDRDLGDKERYKNIIPETWMQQGAAEVMYLSLDQITIYSYKKIFESGIYDIIYINSFFDKNFSIKPLVAYYFSSKKNSKCQVILAPRGEFSVGALGIKKIKKKIYLHLSKIFSLYKNIIFHASSSMELNDIRSAMGILPEKIKIALDIASVAKKVTVVDRIKDEIFSVVFISRISRIKNLDYAIEALQKIKSTINFSIYGPIEDEVYWLECRALIKKLPDNVNVTYYGEIENSEVSSMMACHDLLFLPTKGENFGHVIAESLSAGTPVLISDQTPWRDLKVRGIGWEFPLDEKQLFAKVIDEYASVSFQEREKMRSEILKNVDNILVDAGTINDNIELFR